VAGEGQHGLSNARFCRATRQGDGPVSDGASAHVPSVLARAALDRPVHNVTRWCEFAMLAFDDAPLPAQERLTAGSIRSDHRPVAA
jgi:hypothetical protein